MKIYYVAYQNHECGQLEAFTSRTQAVKRRAELKREDDLEIVYDIRMVGFPITKEGVRQAFERGAGAVPK